MIEVIVVEDHDDYRDLLVKLLDKEGFKAKGFADAESALEARMFPQIYLVDLNLPDMSGYKLIENIRAADSQAEIVILSARTGDNDVSKGYEVGADIVLSKPISAAVLISALNRLSRKFNKESETAVLNLQTSVVTRAEAQATLSQSEGQVLAKLSVGGTEGIPYWGIAELIGFDVDTEFQNKLEVRVLRLRKKLESLGCGGDCIKSIRGYGYRINIPLRVER